MKKSRAKTTASGIAALSSVYYDKAFVANFRNWECACGRPVAHRVEITYKNRRFKRQKRSREIPLCDGCKFRYDVMKAAGRVDEFMRVYAKQCGEYGLLARRPARSGKTIQMYK